MFSNLITLVITASALVTAANKNCVSETKYTLGMFIGDATAPLHAIDQGPAGDVLLVADRELTYPGTPCKLSPLPTPLTHPKKNVPADLLASQSSSPAAPPEPPKSTSMSSAYT